MRNIFRTINSLLSEVCGWLMSVMMMLLVLDIICRNVNRPLQGVPELSVFVMITVIYLGLALCEEYREHVRLELLLIKLHPKVRNPVGFFTYLIELLTMMVLFYAVIDNAILSYLTSESYAGTAQLRIWPVKWVMVVGLFFYIIQLVYKSSDGFKKMISRERQLY